MRMEPIRTLAWEDACMPRGAIYTPPNLAWPTEKNGRQHHSTNFRGRKKRQAFEPAGTTRDITRHCESFAKQREIQTMHQRLAAGPELGNRGVWARQHYSKRKCSEID